MQVKISEIVYLLNNNFKTKSYNYPSLLILWKLCPQLHLNQYVAMKFLSINKAIFYNFPPELKDNKAFVLKLLKSNIDIYYYLNTTLRQDLDILTISIKKNFCTLEHQTAKIKNNIKIVKSFINADANNFFFANNSLKNNKSLINLALKKDPCSIIYLDDSYKNNNKLKQSFIKNFDISNEQDCISHLRNFPFFDKKIQESEKILRLVIAKDNHLTVSTYDTILTALQDSYVQSDGLFKFLSIVLENSNSDILHFNLSHSKMMKNTEFVKYAKHLGFLKNRRPLIMISTTNLSKILEMKKAFDLKKSIEQEVHISNKNSKKIKY